MRLRQSGGTPGAIRRDRRNVANRASPRSRHLVLHALSQSPAEQYIRILAHGESAARINKSPQRRERGIIAALHPRDRKYLAQRRHIDRLKRAEERRRRSIFDHRKREVTN